MIQRIQTVYLFFAGLLIFALYFFPLAHHVYLDAIPSTIKVTGIFQEGGEQLVNTRPFTTLTAVTAIVGLIPMIIIFFFRDRKKQIAFSYSAILVIIGFSFWMAQTVKNATGGVTLGTNNLGIGIFLTCISIFLLIMAVKNIQKDQALIKSADRLR